MDSSAANKDAHPETLEQRADNLNREYTFDNFVIGSSNRFTHAAAFGVAEATLGEMYNPLYIYGGPGTGKTHLLHAIGNFISERDPSKNIMYITADGFVKEYRTAPNRNGLVYQFMDKYGGFDVFLLDDAEHLNGAQAAQEILLDLMTRYKREGKQVVIAADRLPKEIEDLNPDLRRYFKSGLVTDIQPPSLETKIHILRRDAKSSGLNVPDEVLQLIAVEIGSNIRALKDCFQGLVKYSRETNQPLSVAPAAQSLKLYRRVEGEIIMHIDLNEAGEPPRLKGAGLKEIAGRLERLKTRLQAKKPAPEKVSEAGTAPPQEPPAELEEITPPATGGHVLAPGQAMSPRDTWINFLKSRARTDGEKQ